MTDSDQKIRELTQRISVLEEELLRAQRLSSVGALASSITHEFNNILTTVINYARMGMRHTDDATRTKSFDRILSASQRAAKITTSMLSYSRSSSNRPEPVDLKRLLEEVLVLVQKDLQIHRIQVDVHAAASVWALASSSQIQQLLMNLIINARQAMPENGRLRLIVRDNPGEGWAEVVVADSGCGIPQDKLPFIFDSFYTTKKPDEHGQGGTGLGLALCRRIVEAHKGRIRVESEPGRGTTFTLRLPRSEQAAGFITTSTTPHPAVVTTPTPQLQSR
jgi:signal transduction histidine kinase